MTHLPRAARAVYSAIGAISVALAPGIGYSARTIAAQPVNALEEVIVTASRRPERLVDTLASASLMDRSTIETRQYATFAQLLADLPGVVVANNGGIGKASSLFIRGAEADHNLVLVNGLRWSSTTLGTAAVQDLPLELIERVEVVRGPRSSLYGADAVGGVVQIFTRRAPDSSSIRWDALAGYGSAQTRNLAINAGASTVRGFWQFGVSSLESDGTNSCRGFGAPIFAGCFTDEPDDDGYRNTSITARGGFEVGARSMLEGFASLTTGRVEFDGSFQNSSKIRQGGVGASLALQRDETHRVTVQAGRTIDESRNFSGSRFVSRFDTARDSASVQADQPITSTLSAIIGADYLRDSVSSTTVYTETSRRNLGVFTELQQTLGTHTVQAGLRYDDNQRYGGKRTASIGWGWKFQPGWHLTATAGSGFKAPSFNELYFPGFSNAALKPENSTSVETSLRWIDNTMSFGITAYENRIDDLIGFDANFSPVNVDETRIRGLELTGATTLGAWHLNGSAEWLTPRNESPGSNRGKLLPRRAKQVARLDLERSLGTVTLGARTQYQGRRYDNLANTRVLNPWFLLDLRAEWAVSSALRVQARLDNALDRRYESASFYAQPGREWHLALRYAAQ
ncbi:MAG: TonB-dependent receptor [Sinobacteraceae bacterium]|nr:TonB-dependent receptor [Nevskiaceae bacterium]